MTDTFLALEGELSFLSLDLEDGGAILVTRDTAPIVTLVESPVRILTALAGQGPAGAPGRDGDASDITFTATRQLSGHMAVFADPTGALAYASADDPTSAQAFVGITLNAASIGGEVAVRFTGLIIEPSWSWVTGPVFVGLGGSLTQVDPVSGYALAVGVATGPQSLLVAPKPPVFIA